MCKKQKPLSLHSRLVPISASQIDFQHGSHQEMVGAGRSPRLQPSVPRAEHEAQENCRWPRVASLEEEKIGKKEKQIIGNSKRKSKTIQVGLWRPSSLEEKFNCCSTQSRRDEQLPRRLIVWTKSLSWSSKSSPNHGFWKPLSVPNRKPLQTTCWKNWLRCSCFEFTFWSWSRAQPVISSSGS